MKKPFKNKSLRPDWVLKHKQPGTEIKRINGKYYVYRVRSEYDKSIKRARKISLGMLGSITEKDGFVPSDKKRLREKADRIYAGKEVFALEYGYSKWLMTTMEPEQKNRKCVLIDATDIVSYSKNMPIVKKG